MSLEQLVAAELSEPVDPRVRDMAAVIAKLYPGAARGVLFYGSCLRERELDGLMLDFYLIVSDYRAAYGRGWFAFANSIIPPNVFPFQHDGLAAKYAVLSEADFARECSREAPTASVWARFSQPSRLVWSAEEGAAETITQSVAQAVRTFLALASAEGQVDSLLDLWRRGFERTYGAELRAERNARPGAIVDADPNRYQRFGEAALGSGIAAVPAARWRTLRRNGKLFSALRLMKATTTFAGGADYLVWKINRHAGTAIELKPWQRRWPIVAGLILLPRLLKQRAIR